MIIILERGVPTHVNQKIVCQEDKKGGKEKKEGSGHVISHNIPSAKKS